MFSAFIKGYITVHASGPYKERLINLCGKRGIYVWDIENEEDIVSFHILKKDYDALNRLLEKTAAKAVLVEKHGLPFLLNQVKRKIYLLFGFAFGVSFILILQCFIWNIRIEGNEAITRSQFEKFLIEEKIIIPSLASSIDCYKLKDTILSSFDEVSWVSIEKKGCSLRIIVKEKSDVVDLVDEAQYRKDLYAKNDGVIVSIITRSGVPNVKKGDRVKKGDLLVCGEIPIYNEEGIVKNTQLCIADADIVIESDLCRHIYIPFQYKNKDYIKEKSFPWICIGGIEVSPVKKLNQTNNMEVIKEYSCHNRLNKLSNALCFGRYHVKWYDYQIVSYTDQEKNRLIQEKTDYLMKRMQEKNITIKQKNVTIQKNDKKWDIIVNFQIWTKQ